MRDFQVNQSRAPQYGPVKLSLAEIRRNSVKVSLNEEELSLLDRARSEIPRGAFLRMALIDSRIDRPIIPPLNQSAYQELARSASNLNQIAHHLNSSDFEFDESLINNIIYLLNDFRLKLISIKDQND